MQGGRDEVERQIKNKKHKYVRRYAPKKKKENRAGGRTRVVILKTKYWRQQVCAH